MRITGYVGSEKLAVEGGTGPGGSVGSNDGIRRGGGYGKDGGRSREGSGKVNHGGNSHIIIVKRQSLVYM